METPEACKCFSAWKFLRSATVPGLRPWATEYRAFSPQTPGLRPWATEYRAFSPVVPGLRPWANEYRAFSPQIPGLRPWATECRAFSPVVTGLRPWAAECRAFSPQIPGLRPWANEYRAFSPVRTAALSLAIWLATLASLVIGRGGAHQSRVKIDLAQMLTLDPVPACTDLYTQDGPQTPTSLLVGESACVPMRPSTRRRACKGTRCARSSISCSVQARAIIDSLFGYQARSPTSKLVGVINV